MADRPLRNEFGLIARYFAPLARGHAGAFGLTDDAATLAVEPGHELVITNDVLVAGVHYLPDDPPKAVARKLLRVNLSDLAAMGAHAKAYSLGLALPETLSSDWLEAFATGLEADQARFGVTLIGGDTVATDGPAVLSLTAYGVIEAGRALRRAGAQAGDRIFVSGTIGDAALGLLVLRDQLGTLDAAHRAHLLARYREPEPRLDLGRSLVGLAHAAIDISDGLAADLGHICETSGVGARIDAARVPLSPAAAAALAGGAALIETVLSGGDDYELLFCAPAAQASAIANLSKALGLPITEIGAVETEPGVRIIGPDGRPIALARGGYSHF